MEPLCFTWLALRLTHRLPSKGPTTKPKFDLLLLLLFSFNSIRDLLLLLLFSFNSIRDSKKKRGMLGFIELISINAIFSSSSSALSLVRLPLPPQHASDAAAPCLRSRSLRPPPLPASAAPPHILGGTNYQYHHPVKFHRERTRTRATLDDTEIVQLSSTPLLVEDDKPSKRSGCAANGEVGIWRRVH
ncbi:hypothetical protein Ahy_A07g035049 [Arachis hypogaea]|uniref:Uncharacterized protein n=1 Tax=Arachis hypogaea TaxID=3818 RepID=A0A445CDB1_ARAHY|nr:hypothetical protein Ahy_A07g035049 [Arachis hypogaea]